MAFQRSYSKVWWGSHDTGLIDGAIGIRMKNHTHQPIVNNNTKNSNNSDNNNIGLACDFYDLNLSIINNNIPSQEPKSKRQEKPTYPAVQQPGYHTLSLNPYKCFNGNLPCIQEVKNENNSPKLTWYKHNSPRSLRSLDSGFSDNEEYAGGRTSKPVSPSRHSLRSLKSDFNSPTSIYSVATPPTVIRRTGRSKFYAPLVNVSRRISISTPRKKNSIPVENTNAATDCTVNNISKSRNLYSSESYEYKFPKNLADNDVSLTSSSSGTIFFDRLECRHETNHASLRDSTSHFEEYNNETVYLANSICNNSALSIPSYNNETVLLANSLKESTEQTDVLSSLRLPQNPFKCKTSTPKMERRSSHLTPCAFMNRQTFLHVAPPVQRWLNNLSLCCEHEVMSTLQTKSIVQEAFKNVTITTNTVAKLIRQLQQKALYMQTSFECVERLIIDGEQRSLSEALHGSIQLIEDVQEFSQILQRRGVFFSDSRLDYGRYKAHLDQIRLVAKDTRYSIVHHHYINVETLLEDIQVLKRNLLITLRQVYVKLLRILVQSIEHNNRRDSDLMLRANINMIATIMNINYDGFASLTDAFVQTEVVRTLLLVCSDHRLSSVRAMALRALATICSSPEPISQLSSYGGIEILRDILKVSNFNGCASSVKVKRGEMEKREAVSLLTQITAHWHGPNHKVVGLRACLEPLIEGLTDLLSYAECPETLLLCAAALNNLSRMEITAHYSIMSHETIFKLIEVTKLQNSAGIDEKGVSIFLYEQIVAMLQIMSQNKKCHSHLANANITNFIMYAYQTEFQKCYSSRGESEAQKRTIKSILHILARLTQDSVLGIELLEQQKPFAAISLKNFTTTTSIKDKDQQQQQSPPLDNNSYNHEITSLGHHLLQEQKQGQKQYQNQGQQQTQQLKSQQQQQKPEKQHQQSRQLQYIESMEGHDNVDELSMQVARQESYV